MVFHSACVCSCGMRVKARCRLFVLPPVWWKVDSCALQFFLLELATRLFLQNWCKLNRRPKRISGITKEILHLPGASASFPLRNRILFLFFKFHLWFCLLFIFFYPQHEPLPMGLWINSSLSHHWIAESRATWKHTYYTIKSQSQSNLLSIIT